MDWFSQLALERDRGNADEAALSRKASALWTSLRAMLRACQSIYDARYPIGTGAVVQYEEPSPEQSVVRRREVAAGNPGADIVTVTVTFTSPVITAVYSTARAPMVLSVGRNSAGYAELLFEDEAVCLDRAAQMILQRVLFPELPE